MDSVDKKDVKQRASYFAKTTPLFHYSMFKLHKEDKEIPEKYKCSDFYEMRRIARAILIVLGEHIIKKRGGVIMDRWGYFAHWRTPKRMFMEIPRKGEKKKIYNYDTDGYFYNTSWLPTIFSRNSFVGWTMDRAFNTNIKKGRFLELKRGIKYLFYYSTARRIFDVKLKKYAGDKDDI